MAPTQHRNPPPDRTQRRGRALVILAGSGYAYEGIVTIDKPFVHIVNARRRICEDAYRQCSDHTWPAGSIRAIRWLGDEAGQIAA